VIQAIEGAHFLQGVPSQWKKPIIWVCGIFVGCYTIVTPRCRWMMCTLLRSALGRLHEAT